MNEPMNTNADPSGTGCMEGLVAQYAQAQRKARTAVERMVGINDPHEMSQFLYEHGAGLADELAWIADCGETITQRLEDEVQAMQHLRELLLQNIRKIHGGIATEGE